MTYEAIVEFMKKNVKKSKTASVKNHVAVEFDIYGEGEGAFTLKSAAVFRLSSLMNIMTVTQRF